MDIMAPDIQEQAQVCDERWSRLVENVRLQNKNSPDPSDDCGKTPRAKDEISRPSSSSPLRNPGASFEWLL
ncbi:hypothetical protein VM1G_11645 [Cytospora mali]|uniref:Uncharacterized protein n=1 Tax=Cytospora mali TaxID=578113 RepID=A0A194VZZ8_CYTMA|nr:hypothetical protein VM1G_11645 [Valsa mali]